MARRRHRRLELNADINVVSLIDVMLLLLVIFMITAPMMQGGVDITLPQAEARPITSKSSM
ncbi:MAG: biopolymer transporter ExbD, partial [Gemmatimonadota bacterium]|nr:biopolymer transporter ExbD [Gemmatimonadota bacterium]